MKVGRPALAAACIGAALLAAGTTTADEPAVGTVEIVPPPASGGETIASPGASVAQAGSGSTAGGAAAGEGVGASAAETGGPGEAAGVVPPGAGASALPPPLQRPSRTLRDWYDMGGIIMHLLGVCSVLIVAVSLERLWSLRRGAVAPRGLVKRVREAARAADIGGLGALEGRSVLARLVALGVSELRRGNRHPQEVVAAAGGSQAQRLRRNLPLLAALANMATMLGLLGTVLGMIEAFETIATVGTSDARIVARGIFQALVTTAGGLSIALVALGAHTWFRRRVDGYVVELEEELTDLFEHVAPNTSAAEEGGATPELRLAPAEG